MGRGFWIRMPAGGASETGGPPKPASTPHVSTTDLAPAETGALNKLRAGDADPPRFDSLLPYTLCYPIELPSRWGAKYMRAATWWVEAGLGGPVRSLRPLSRPYGPKHLPPRPSPAAALGERLLVPYGRRRSLRNRIGPPKPASHPMYPPQIRLPPRRGPLTSSGLGRPIHHDLTCCCRMMLPNRASEPVESHLYLGGDVGGRGRFGQTGPVSEAIPTAIRTQKQTPRCRGPWGGAFGPVWP